MSDILADLRRTYDHALLLEEECPSSPFPLFDGWLKEAFAAARDSGDAPFEPTAMTLSTVGSDGRPSSRVVLLKGVEDASFLFFTNFESRKGMDLSINPFAALCFYWHHCGRQVRIEGRVEKISREASKAYFNSRPEGSRIGAWASEQSRVIDNRESVDGRAEGFRKKFAGTDIPCPPYWGGYRVIPESIEFWQGRPDRLHDRIVYRVDGSDWRRQRLAP